MTDVEVQVEALTELNIPGQKTKKKGEKLSLPESTVKILEAGDDPSVKRVKVGSAVDATAKKLNNGDSK